MSEHDVADLERQLAVLNERIKDAKSHGSVREQKLTAECADLERQNALLKNHVKSLDAWIKKLSLVHSQLTAVPNYKLAKPDVDEIIRLVGSL